MFPIANLSRSLKVLLLVVAVAGFTLLSVAATGRRTGNSRTPENTNIPNTEKTNNQRGG